MGCILADIRINIYVVMRSVAVLGDVSRFDKDAGSSGIGGEWQMIQHNEYRVDDTPKMHMMVT